MKEKSGFGFQTTGRKEQMKAVHYYGFKVPG